MAAIFITCKILSSLVPACTWLIIPFWLWYLYSLLHGLCGWLLKNIYSKVRKRQPKRAISFTINIFSSSLINFVPAFLTLFHSFVNFFLEETLSPSLLSSFQLFKTKTCCLMTSHMFNDLKTIYEKSST